MFHSTDSTGLLIYFSGKLVWECRALFRTAFDNFWIRIKSVRGKEYGRCSWIVWALCDWGEEAAIQKCRAVNPFRRRSMTLLSCLGRPSYLPWGAYRHIDRRGRASSSAHNMAGEVGSRLLCEYWPYTLARTVLFRVVRKVLEKLNAGSCPPCNIIIVCFVRFLHVLFWKK